MMSVLISAKGQGSTDESESLNKCNKCATQSSSPQQRNNITTHDVSGRLGQRLHGKKTKTKHRHLCLFLHRTRWIEFMTWLCLRARNTSIKAQIVVQTSLQQGVSMHSSYRNVPVSVLISMFWKSWSCKNFPAVVYLFRYPSCVTLLATLLHPVSPCPPKMTSLAWMSHGLDTRSQQP